MPATSPVLSIRDKKASVSAPKFNRHRSQAPINAHHEALDTVRDVQAQYDGDTDEEVTLMGRKGRVCQTTRGEGLRCGRQGRDSIPGAIGSRAAAAGKIGAVSGSLVLF